MKLSKRNKKRLQALKAVFENYKHSLKKKTKGSVKLVTKLLKAVGLVTLAFTAIVSSVLTADWTHKEYMEHVIGDQVLMIVNMSDSKLKGYATGFHVKARSGKPVFITNAHVCELANSQGLILVHDKVYSKRFIPRRVLEVYEHNDLCAVEPIPGYSGLTLASGLSVGEPVWAIGFPLGEALNITDGRVKEFSYIHLITRRSPDDCEGPRRSKHTLDYYLFKIHVCVEKFHAVQTDLTIFGGNSGSPMVNIWGNVTGVVFASNTKTHWGSSVPLGYLQDLLKAY